MAVAGDRYAGIEKNIGANLRVHREAASVSQEDLAQRMTDRGFGFSQATIWKIESGQRPVKVSELVGLADSLELWPMSPMSLTGEPGATRHEARMRQAHHNAHDAYMTLKAAAAAYIEAQFNLLVTAREAQDDGVAVTKLYTSWLTTPPEEAVIEARVETYQEDSQRDHISDEVIKVVEALRTVGYDPVMRVEDLQIISGEPLPAGPPATRDTSPEEPGRQA